MIRQYQPYNEIRLSIDGKDGQATDLGAICF